MNGRIARVVDDDQRVALEVDVVRLAETGIIDHGLGGEGDVREGIRG
jgi:hypothetical protein